MNIFQNGRVEREMLFSKLLIFFSLSGTREVDILLLPKQHKNHFPAISPCFPVVSNFMFTSDEKFIINIFRYHVVCFYLLYSVLCQFRYCGIAIINYLCYFEN